MLAVHGVGLSRDQYVLDVYNSNILTNCRFASVRYETPIVSRPSTAAFEPSVMVSPILLAVNPAASLSSTFFKGLDPHRIEPTVLFSGRIPSSWSIALTLFP